MSGATTHRSTRSDSNLERLRIRADQEFTDVSDVIWKLPRIIEHETKLEFSKLEVYFPNNPQYQKFRWRLESHMLRHTFPYLISAGNLFGVVSLFESYLLLLAAELQKHSSLKLREIKGQGLSRLFTFFKSCGISPEKISLHEQVQAALKIRNCMAHASGMLDWSRDNDVLRKIVSEGTYLSQEHRAMRRKRRGIFNEVVIGSSALGGRLMVDNQYCHVLCSYLRSYFDELCATAIIAQQTKKY